MLLEIILRCDATEVTNLFYFYRQFHFVTIFRHFTRSLWAVAGSSSVLRIQHFGPYDTVHLRTMLKLP
jgi:hypothetical protein